MKITPKADLTDSELERFTHRARQIAGHERPEVLFAIASFIGVADSLGGSEYRSWVEAVNDYDYTSRPIELVSTDTENQW
jgi:hypothetical protein